MDSLKYVKGYGFFLVASTLFLVHQFVEPFHHHSMVDSFLDDVLFLPIAYSIVLILVRALTSQQFTMPLLMVVSGWFITGLFTEGLFPILSEKHTADVYDLIAYAVGGALFMWLGNKPIQ